MLKLILHFAFYVATLLFALLATPYFAVSYDLVTVDNVSYLIALSPFALWATYFAHGVLFDNSVAVAIYLFTRAKESAPISLSSKQPEFVPVKIFIRR